jgi:hypothetical protein
MLTPDVPLDAAEPEHDAAVAAPPALTTQPEYVYLSRVATRPQFVNPNANIPTVLFPAAEPQIDATVAAPPALTTQPEYVYLLRVVT